MAKKLKRFRCGIYGIIVKQGRILVCETRTPTSSFANFPGGGISLGEDPEAALIRELREETGLAVRPKQILWATMSFHRGHVKPQQQLMGTYWLLDVIGGKLNTKGNGDDVLRAFWVTPDELLDQPFTTFDREALPAIVAATKGQARRRAPR